MSIAKSIFAILLFATFAAKGLDKKFKPKMQHKLAHHEADNATLEEFHFMTRYDHDFNKSEEGNCGELFNRAKKIYETKLSELQEFKNIVKQIQNGNGFKEEKCRKNSAGYTWVLLKSQNDNIVCEVHVPLNLLNFHLEDNEDHPHFNLEYAKTAINKKDTRCYKKYSDDNLTKFEKLKLQKSQKIKNEYDFINDEDLNLSDLFVASETSDESSEDNEERLKRLSGIRDTWNNVMSELLKKAKDKEDLNKMKSNEDNEGKTETIVKEESESSELKPLFFDIDDTKSENNKEIDGTDESDNTMIETSKTTKKTILDHDSLFSEYLNPNNLIGGTRGCLGEHKSRIISLYNTKITEKTSIGFKIYSENILKCIYQNVRDTIIYRAILNFNDEYCYFNITDNFRGDFHFGEDLELKERLISCERKLSVN